MKTWIGGVLTKIIAGIGAVVVGVAIWWLTDGPLGPSTQRELTHAAPPNETISALSKPWPSLAGQNVSGRYQGHITVEAQTPNGVLQKDYGTILNIRSLPNETTIVGTVSLIIPSQNLNSTTPLEGDLIGNKLTFVSRKEGEEEYMWFEGELIGGSIRGIYGINVSQEKMASDENFRLLMSQGIIVGMRGRLEVYK